MTANAHFESEISNLKLNLKFCAGRRDERCPQHDEEIEEAGADMKRSKKIGLIISSLTIIIFCAVIFFVFIFPMVRNLNDMRRQVLAGQKYMDSLTESDIPVWIDRTKNYLDEYGTNEYFFVEKSVPSDLQQLKIWGIDVEPNCVSYVWNSGFDDTKLYVE